MSKIGWDYALYKFGCARFGKSAVDDESVNESVDDVPVNEPIVD